MQAPAFKRWTVAECDLLREQGFLPERYELIEGTIFDIMGKNALHTYITKCLLKYLLSLVAVDYVRVQEPIRITGELGQTNEPEPDLVVTKQSDQAYAKRHPEPSQVALLIEVSDSTIAFDLNTKALLYSRAGIPEYWVADVAGERLIVHRTPTQSGYSEVTAWEVGQSVSPLASPANSLSVASLYAPLHTEESQ